MPSQRPFQDQFIDFSIDVLKLVSRLPSGRIGRHIADQLMRSSTSVGANVQEARSAESGPDFIHKMQVALKELRETGYWLIVIDRGHILKEGWMPDLKDRCEQLTAILAKSVITAKKNAA